MSRVHIASCLSRGDGPQAISQARCFACGRDNVHGLHLRFRNEGAGVVCADWRPAEHSEGFAGIVHGGIVATVLDEAMSKAVASMNWPALTCSLEVRLHHHVGPGECLTVHGRVVERRKRRILTEALLQDCDGRERARAKATFLMVGQA